MPRMAIASSPTYKSLFSPPAMASYFGRPTMDGNTTRGTSSPANPALTMPLPLSQTNGVAVCPSLPRGNFIIINCLVDAARVIVVAATGLAVVCCFLGFFIGFVVATLLSLFVTGTFFAIVVIAATVVGAVAAATVGTFDAIV